MATTALGTAYVLTPAGADALIAIADGESAPIAPSGFVSRFERDGSSRHEGMARLERRLTGGSSIREK